MFSGIIETTGRVLGATPRGGGVTLEVDAGRVAEDAQVGASIAVNGVCLTVSRVSGPHLAFDVIRETLNRSTLGRLKTGDRVNLERSLAVGGRLDGHFVQGHVEGQARLTRRTATGQEFVLWFAVHHELMPAIIPKGSVAVDGISLTIAEISGSEFSVALTPTTLERTTLGSLSVGDSVNLETDILARTVVQTLSNLQAGSSRSLTPSGRVERLTLEKLSEHGFA